MAFASLGATTTEAFVTLATNDDYSLGALVLAYSLREVATTKKLHCMITDQVTAPFREQLARVFDDVSVVDVLASGDEHNLALIGRPDLALAFTKLNCWRLTQYSKAVFLDADTLVLRNVDELFGREEFSAAPDIGWPDFFNSGVFVYRPNEETYRALLHKATTEGSFDGADQGLLNAFFSGWREASSEFRLPFIYNVTGGIFYTYKAAYNKLREQVKIVHFIGTQKPWRGGVGLQLPEFAQVWHRIYERHVAGTVPGSSTMRPRHGHLVSVPESSTILIKAEVRVSTVPSNLPQHQHNDVMLTPELRISLQTPLVHECPSSMTSVTESNMLQSFSSTNVPDELVAKNQAVPQSSNLEGDHEQSSEESRTRWEQGRPDFTGKDAFAEIQEALMKNLQ